MNRNELVEEVERQKSFTTPVKRWSIPIPDNKKEQTPMPTPIKDWTPRPSPERKEDHEEEPQITYVSFPTRRVMSRKDYIQDSRITNDMETTNALQKCTPETTEQPNVSTTQDTNALQNSPTTVQPNISFLQEETFKDVNFRTNPKACENAVRRLKTIAFYSPGLMPMEQISKLQEVLHLFKMESQDIFETKWLTQIALPFTDGSRKAFTHLVNTGLYKDNAKTQNTTSTITETQTSTKPTTSTASTASTMTTRPTTTPRYQHGGLTTKRDLRTILQKKQARRD